LFSRRAAAFSSSRVVAENQAAASASTAGLFGHPIPVHRKRSPFDV
jgi:hypothetical protein